MTDDQIDTMLKMHRYLIVNEINAWVHKVNENDDASKLQEQKNKEDWNNFALWLKKIRDE